MWGFPLALLRSGIPFRKYVKKASRAIRPASIIQHRKQVPGGLFHHNYFLYFNRYPLFLNSGVFEEPPFLNSGAEGERLELPRFTTSVFKTDPINQLWQPS
jgi:hypothetical protein